jgi:nucleoside-diphosphate kinase
MMKTPVVISVWKGVDVVEIAHHMAGATNGRMAAPGTIRGDYSVSIQENIVHTSDTVENAKLEIARFFKENEIFDFNQLSNSVLYADNEV